MSENARNIHISCRLTAKEYEKLRKLFDRSSFSENEKKKYSDFLRQQLLYENNSQKINLLYFDIRKIKVELHQAVRRFEKFQNAESESNLIKVLINCTEKLEEVNKNMERLLNGGDCIR